MARYATQLDNPKTGEVVIITTTPDPTQPNTHYTRVTGGKLNNRGSRSYDTRAAHVTHQLWVDAARRVLWRDGMPMEPMSQGQPWHRHSQRYKRSSLI